MRRFRYGILAVALSACCAIPAAAVDHPSALPRVFLLDAHVLRQEKRLASANPQNAILQAVRRAAGRALPEGPFSVMQSKIVPPSGDRHDYMTQGPYWWPNPNKPAGLPYIRRDGERNPELDKLPDEKLMGSMAGDSRTLALAYYLTGDRQYSQRAALLLRAWFIDPATRMNPNFEYAQGIPGITTGRGIGIIESRLLTSAVDAVGLLQGSPDWSASDQEAVKAWFDNFLAWLQTSDHGKVESAAKNNHGTYYDVQVADFALFVGKRDLARSIIEQAKQKRIARQVETDGRQPLELARTKSFGYSAFNVAAYSLLATLGESAGVDLWHYRTADGRSIQAALDFLIPYASGKKGWPYQKILGFHGEELLLPLLRAAKALGDPKYARAADHLKSDPESIGQALLRAALASRLGMPARQP